MSYTDDQGVSRSEPWTYSRNNLPTSVYTDRSLIKCGVGRPKRVKARRRKNYVKPDDVLRFARAIQTPLSIDDTPKWLKKMLEVLKYATIKMMEQILPFLESEFSPVNNGQLYDWIHEMGSKILRMQGQPDQYRESQAVSLISDLAAQVNLSVTFKRL